MLTVYRPSIIEIVIGAGINTVTRFKTGMVLNGYFNAQTTEPTDGSHKGKEYKSRDYGATDSL